jgi:hypothetical protein
VHVPFEHTSLDAHTVPQAPQFCGSLDSVTQTLPHIVSPAGHWLGLLMQCPDVHLSPEAQAWWQAPQWWGSLCRFTHFPAHRL